MKLFVITLLWAAQAALQAVDYEMKDLQLLKERMQWETLLEHMDDIPPSKRDISWDAIAELAVEKRFDELRISDTEGKSITFLHKYLSLYPTLKKNKAFMQKRADFGLEHYGYCFSYNDDKCHKEFVNFVAQDPDPMFAFKVAKQARKRMSDTKAIDYFDLAYDGIKAKQCEDEDLGISVEASLGLDPKRSEVAKAKKLAFGPCKNALKPYITKAIKSSRNGMANTCSLALKHQSISGIALSKCKRYIQNGGGE